MGMFVISFNGVNLWLRAFFLSAFHSKEVLKDLLAQDLLIDVWFMISDLDPLPYNSERNRACNFALHCTSTCFEITHPVTPLSQLLLQMALSSHDNAWCCSIFHQIMTVGVNLYNWVSKSVQIFCCKLYTIPKRHFCLPQFLDFNLPMMFPPNLISFLSCSTLDTQLSKNVVPC